MGLKCSFLGHAYEEAGVEREREEQGSEVVTVVKELEQCRRCGDERVVSESTEVTAVVDADEVQADVDAGAGGAGAGGATGGTGGFGGAVDRAMEEGPDDAETLEGGAGAGADGPATGPTEEPADGHDDAAAKRVADEAAAAVDELAEDPGDDFEARDPEEEDAEILTDDDDTGRGPGEWPDDPVEEDDDRGLEEIEDVADDDGTPTVETELDEEEPDEETLSGITVPEGRIGCPECGFEVDAESSYRDGDPCPECGAWLTTVSG